MPKLLIFSMLEVAHGLHSSTIQKRSVLSRGLPEDVEDFSHGHGNDQRPQKFSDITSITSSLDDDEDGNVVHSARTFFQIH